MTRWLRGVGAWCCVAGVGAPVGGGAGARGAIVDRYTDLEVLALTSRFGEEERFEVFAADRSGACSRRTFWLEMLERNRVERAEDIWREVGADFVFHDEDAVWGRGKNDTYTVSTFEEGRPWGANPVHWCVWVVLSDWTESEGELREAEDGGWALRIEERFMEIRFDSALNVDRILYWYDLRDPEPRVVWEFFGYGEGADPRLPTGG